VARSGSKWFPLLPFTHFTFHSFNHQLFPKFVSLNAMFGQAEFISFLAAFITILNGNARAPGNRLFHLVDEENYSEVQSSVGPSDKKRRSAKMASFLFILIKSVAYCLVPDTSSRGYNASGGSICHFR
jgi:hypothetical protein